MITEHFDSSEFDQHDGVEYPISLIESCLRPLCTMLENIRTDTGPITIVSGYRSVDYNREMYLSQGKTPTDSQHSRGKAADIKCATLSASELHKIIYDAYVAGRLPQLGGLGKYNSFVHVDIRQRVPVGHLAQWDFSSSGDDSGTDGGGNQSADGESEGDEEDESVTSWLLPAGGAILLGVLVAKGML